MLWGNGQIVDEVGIDTEYNEVVIQLMQYDDFDGETLRFCQYWPDGRFQRQPMMLSATDIPTMSAALDASPRIKRLLSQLITG